MSSPCSKSFNNYSKTLIDHCIHGLKHEKIFSDVIQLAKIGLLWIQNFQKPLSGLFLSSKRPKPPQVMVLSSSETSFSSYGSHKFWNLLLCYLSEKMDKLSNRATNPPCFLL